MRSVRSFPNVYLLVATESVSVSSAGAYSNASSYAAKELLLVRSYLDVREAKINNNLIDNALRPFCLGKKNWLFAQTEDGGEASVALYSLIVTAKAVALDPQVYL